MGRAGIRRGRTDGSPGRTGPARAAHRGGLDVVAVQGDGREQTGRGVRTHGDLIARRGAHRGVRAQG